MHAQRTEGRGSSPSRKRFPAEKRRAQLLRIAVELFARRGFEGTTTKAIAAAAGVSEGLIFRHFATKEDLYASILDHTAKESGIEAWEEQLRCYAEREDDQALVRSIVERILQSDRKDPQFQRLMFQAVLTGHPLPRVMAQRILPLHKFLCDYIIKRQKKGAFVKCNPNVAVHAIVSMPSHYGLAKGIFGMDLLKLPERSLAESFTRLVLWGLKTSGKAEGRRGALPCAPSRSKSDTSAER
jgi:TetR/AcrR family transcriptional regulator